jgi:2-desacetyl-2-hydroxyethyl bacteriochlorophyllide A dehydrogenase
VGGGPVGLLIAVVAADRGADVVVVEPDAFRRSVIEGIGIDAVDPATTDAAALMAPRNSGAGPDAVFEVSGSEPGLTLALEVLRPRGRLIVVGIHPQPRQVDVRRIFWRELEIVGARVYERTDYDAAIELIHSGVIPAAALISEVVPLSAVTEAFAALAAGGSVMKVLIDVEGGDV